MSTLKTAATTVVQTLKRHLKAPWEITGPCASPEYKSAVPKATEYRPFFPATEPQHAIIPTANTDTFFDIKYFPPDVQKMMKEKKFDLSDFPQPYLVFAVEEDYNAIGGGYTN
ncbi:hypothetical protein RND81_11G065900 [Saponaria officinalis]|uniref:Uncharacterized protein n=1 Tax=Saponaria officinalis TaxID=3572 RepID=A0AAW1HK99_SAPOF